MGPNALYFVDGRTLVKAGCNDEEEETGAIGGTDVLDVGHEGGIDRGIDIDITC
jgi:hypothetical protein